MTDATLLLDTPTTLMTHKDYIDHYVIGIGRHNHYFTLRMSDLVQLRGGGYRIVYHHVCNLSQDGDIAFEKAKEYALNNGIPLKCPSAEWIKGKLDEIQRETAEERAARERKEREEREIAEERARQKLDLEIEAVSKMLADKIVYKIRMNHPEYIFQMVKEAQEKNPEKSFGHCVAYPFDTDTCNERCIDFNKELSANNIKWLEWFMDGVESGDFDDEISKLKYDFIIKNYKRLAKVDANATAGSVGDKITITVQIINEFTVDGYYGPSTCVKMVSLENGATVVHWNSGKKYGKIGDVLTITGTVKSIQDYRGALQTVITRVKVNK